MSFQYFPLYTGDYLRDTRHLSPCEHGIYLLLLMHCWDQKGPAPLDERKLHGICNVRSGDEIAAMRRVLDEFFTRMDDGHYNKRMDAEVRKAEELSRKYAAAAGRRWSGRNVASHDAEAWPGHSVGSAEGKPRDQTIDLDHRPYTETTTTAEAPVAAEKPVRSRGSRLPDGCPTEEEIEWCRQQRPDLDPLMTRDRFRDHWTAAAGSKGVKADWSATWRNWVRNERPKVTHGNPQRQKFNPYESIRRAEAALARGVGAPVAEADVEHFRPPLPIALPGR